MLKDTKANSVVGLLKKPKSLVFLTFMVVSFILWLLIKLSQVYSYPISLDVSYTNLPEDKLLLKASGRKVNVLVEGTGFNLLKANVFNKGADLDLLKVRVKDNKSYLLSNDIENQLKEQYRVIEIKQVLTDSLIFQFGVNKKKTVPVVPDLELSFETDYGLADSLSITPSEIWIRGPENVIDSIQFIHTEKKVIRNIKDDINAEVLLNKPDSLGTIDIEVQKVSVTARVDRFSEKIIKVPLLIENIPEGTQVRTFPQKLDVVCKAPIEDLKTITADKFLIIADYRDVQNGGGYLIPRLIKKPAFLSDVKLMQTKVEFLLKKG